MGVGNRLEVEIRPGNSPAPASVCPDLVSQRPDRNAKHGGGMSPVSAALGQRCANQFTFDGGNGTAHKLANGLNFSCGEFRVTKEHCRYSRRFRSETIAQMSPPAAAQAFDQESKNV
jgi:hypothetical protein